MRLHSCLSGLTVLFHTLLFQVLDLLWICLFPQLSSSLSSNPLPQLGLACRLYINLPSLSPSSDDPSDPFLRSVSRLNTDVAHHRTQLTYLSCLLSDPPTRTEGL